MSDVLLTPVTFAQVEHADGRGFDAFHFPDLAVTGVSSQHQAAFGGMWRGNNEKRLPLLSGGGSGGHIKVGKDIVVIVNFRIAYPGKTNTFKDLGDFGNSGGDGMEMPDRRQGTRFGDVQKIFGGRVAVAGTD